MIKICFYWALITLLFSCASEQRRKVSEGMIADYGKVTSYFLPVLPKWANFSVEGKCFRSSDIQYLNLKSVSDDYALEYDKLIHLQALFNTELLKLEKEKEIGTIDKAALFYEVVEKVSGDVKYLAMPKFSKYYLLWGDLFTLEEFEVWLKKYINSPYMTDGVPVVISTCQNAKKLEAFLEERSLDADYPYIIGAEAFSIFNEKLSQMPRFYLNLAHFIPKDAEIKWVVPENHAPYLPEGIRAEQKIEIQSF